MSVPAVVSYVPEPALGPEPAHPLTVVVLGGVHAVYRGERINLQTRKAKAALACIALSAERRESRERLVGLLWSESDESRARSSLRQALKELRQAFRTASYSGLQSEKLDLGLSGPIDLDIITIINSTSGEDIHPAVLESPRLLDNLLKGLDDIDPAFRVWLLAKRQTLHDQLIRNLEAGLRSNLLPPARRMLLAQAVLCQDPSHEEACQYLMAACAAQGDVATALRHYKALWNTLDDEYGMEPSAKTRELVAAIKQGAFDSGSAPPLDMRGALQTHPLVEAASQVLVRSSRESQATLPYAKVAPKVALFVQGFGMNGVESDQVHLVHGFRHHLIASLVRFREWFVIDRAVQKESHSDSEDLSEYQIEGTAYRTGETISLVLTLRETRHSLYIWSDMVELRLENWFNSQQRIVEKIAASLNVQISTERLMRLADVPDVSLDVYDRWLRGQAMIIGFSPANWSRAAQIFSEIIVEAPSFSRAYSSLAQMNNAVHIVHPGVYRDATKAEKTLDLARTAVQVDPLDSRAQLCLGWAYAMSKQYRQAGVHIDLACDLNENDAWTFISAALFNSFRGRHAHAEALSERAFALSLNPSATFWAYEVSTRFLRADYRGALEAADRAGDVIRTLPGWRAAALYQLGKVDEAALSAARLFNLIRSNWYGTTDPTEEEIGRWLLHLYPISERPLWEFLRESMVGGGIPVVGLRHHDW